MDTAKQKEAMIAALEANFGNITKAAKAAKISVTTHYRWLKEDMAYGTQTMSIKDICYGKIQDTLLEAALKKVAKGDSTTLNQMLRLFYKNLDEDMKRLSIVNRVPIIKARIVPVSTPQDPTREGYVRPM